MSEHSITQKQLAEKIEKPYKSVNNWFSNRSFTPKTSDAVKIARALKTTVEYLETGEEEQISDVRRRFLQFINQSSDEDLQKMWDFFAVMRGK